MSAPKRWELQQIFTQTYKNVQNTDVYGTIDDLKTCSIENNQDTVYSSGGVGNVYIGAHSFNKRTTGTATAATFKNAILQLITGTDVVTGAATVPINGEVQTVTSNASVTSYTAVGTADAEIIKLVELNTDGTFGTEYTQVSGSPATGEFQYDSGTKALTFFAGDITDGTEIVLFYEANTDATAHTITNDSGEFSKIVRIEMDTLVQDTCFGDEYAAKLIVYKAKLTGSWMLDVASDGEVSNLDLSFEALKAGCTSSKLWDLVIIDTIV